MRGKVTDHAIGEFFPPQLLVGARQASVHSKGCVEQQYPLLRPSGKIAEQGRGDAEVAVDLFEDIP